jgi:hypothetical protein
MRKGKDTEQEPDPYLLLLDLDPDQGGPKTCGSGSPTLGISAGIFIFWTIFTFTELF